MSGHACDEWACLCGDEQLVALLLKQGATRQPLEQRFHSLRVSPANTSPMDWMTPLAFAVQVGREEMVDVLLEMGADSDVTSPTGDTLEALARANGHTALLDRLGNDRPVR